MEFWKYFIIVVILLIGIFCTILFYQKPYEESSPELDLIKNRVCGNLWKNDCKNSTYSILIEDFDANRDGEINNDDTLFELCKNYYGLKTDADCKKIGCGCP